MGLLCSLCTVCARARVRPQLGSGGGGGGSDNDNDAYGQTNKSRFFVSSRAEHLRPNYEPSRASPAGLSLGPARPGPARPGPGSASSPLIKNSLQKMYFFKKILLILGQKTQVIFGFVSFFLIQFFIPARPGSGPRASPARPERSISKKSPVRPQISGPRPALLPLVYAVFSL